MHLMRTRRQYIPRQSAPQKAHVHSPVLLAPRGAAPMNVARHTFGFIRRTAPHGRPEPANRHFDVRRRCGRQQLARLKNVRPRRWHLRSRERERESAILAVTHSHAASAKPVLVPSRRRLRTKLLQRRTQGVTPNLSQQHRITVSRDT